MVSSFPPPLKDPLPSDTPSASTHPGAAVYRELYPFGMYPSGNTIVLVSPSHLPPPPPPVPLTLPAEEDDNYHIDRRDLSYTSYILSSWQRAVLQLSTSSADDSQWSFPTYEQVKATEQTTTKNYISYEHAGVEWRSSYYIKVMNNVPVLIIHLANDGLLYFEPNTLQVDALMNKRHTKTTPLGWMVFKEGEGRETAKAKLSDFRAFAETFFGTTEIRQSILYNPEFWRLDICFQSKVNNVGLEFSFERDWPLPREDYWWD